VRIFERPRICQLAQVLDCAIQLGRRHALAGELTSQRLSVCETLCGLAAELLRVFRRQA